MLPECRIWVALVLLLRLKGSIISRTWIQVPVNDSQRSPGNDHAWGLMSPQYLNIARNANRSSNRAHPCFGGIPVTGLIGGVLDTFFRITED